MADDGPTSSSGGSDPLTAVADQDEDLGKSVSNSFEADVGSTEGSHFVSSDSFFDVTPGFMSEEQMMFAGSAADASTC